MANQLNKTSVNNRKTASVQPAPLPALVEKPDPLKTVPKNLKPGYKPPPLEDLFSVKPIVVPPTIEKTPLSPQIIDSIEKVDRYPLIIELSDEEADQGSYHPTAPKISSNPVESSKESPKEESSGEK